MTNKLRIIAGIASALLLHGVVSSQNKPINTTCIITGKAIPVDAPTSMVRGAVLAFCCKKCKAKYDADPSQYTDKVRGIGERRRKGYGGPGGNKITDPAEHTKAMAKPIFSGPQKGEKLRPFKVTGLFGDDKGKEFDPVTRAGDDMHLLLFTKGVTGGRIVPLLGRQLSGIMKGSGKTWRASVVHLSDNPNEVSKYASKFEGRIAGFFDMGIAKDGAAGPGSYGLDRTATHTFLFAKNGKVVHNLVFTQQVFFNEPHLLGAIADVMGVDHKTLGKWLYSQPSRADKSDKSGKRGALTKQQKAFRKELGERLKKGEITREEAGRLYRAKFPSGQTGGRR